jgi:membrane protein YqaA with SNARE-associated domain
MSDLAILTGLFAVSFLAATIFPAQSEVALLAVVASGRFNILVPLAVASTGNILGAMLNWALGRGITKFEQKSWFPASGKSLERAAKWYAKWGRWSLLLSWVPIVGDALTVTAGILREPFWSFALLVTIAKTGRYLALFGIGLALTS